ncbi:hypothetical protein [Actinacidiphila sp. ITFR-21]|uniref:hypothetical protein n=1 Tax=Actinacidiphila sp. ITFR-21 TaxID=3075199 RepID=UPI00288A60F4|nr:hypothetical protein [Streptomyces sp. ITFR-21]WNI16897.1 hypothetical protein RLT57_16135 [Streptomyces sp. ITFR-21]
MRAAVRLVGGLRPAALMVLGTGWILYGRSIITDPGYARSRGLAGITRYIPLSSLGWVWVAAGAVAVLAGLGRRMRYQAPGFTALSGPAVLWGVTYARSAWAGGLPSSSGSAAAWLAFSVFIVLCAGMSEPPWVVGILYDKKGGDRD